MFFVYVIYSVKLGKYYVGTTDDVIRRVDEDNLGLYEASFTSKGIPGILQMEFGCKNSNLAYKLEAFIKRMKSKKFIEKIIKSPEILEDIHAKLQ